MIFPLFTLAHQQIYTKILVTGSVNYCFTVIPILIQDKQLRTLKSAYNTLPMFTITRIREFLWTNFGFNNLNLCTQTIAYL